MTVLKAKNLNRLPFELVDLIADYHDYEKYYKPSHYENLKGVINDIGDMASIMHTIMPNIAWQCWGAGANNLVYYENNGWNDDEENNFGMENDDEEDNYSEEEDDEQPYRASSEEGYFGGFWYNGWDSDN